MARVSTRIEQKMITDKELKFLRSICTDNLKLKPDSQTGDDPMDPKWTKESEKKMLEASSYLRKLRDRYNLDNQVIDLDTGEIKTI